MKINRESFDEVIKRFEGKVTVTDQSSFTKIEGPVGRRLYVPRTKNVSRVDLSGFEVDTGKYGVTDLGESSFGAVKQQLAFGEDAAVVLANFEMLLEHMIGLPPVEKVKKTDANKEKQISAAKEKIRAAKEKAKKDPKDQPIVKAARATGGVGNLTAWAAKEAE